jgi:hypothetical protein
MEEEDHAEFPPRIEFQENESKLDAHRVKVMAGRGGTPRT